MKQSFLRGVVLAAALTAIIAPLGARADMSAGSYLAGRQALRSSDFDKAAQYYARALARDRDNPNLMEQVVLSQLALGRIDKALPVAKRIEEKDLRSQVAHLVVIVDLIENGEFDAILERDPETLGAGPLVDGLLAGWTHMGAGSVSKALEQFDTVAKQQGLQSFALYHKALALASVGDFEGAEAIFADESTGLAIFSRGAAIARAQILSQLERNEDAIAFLADAFGTRLDPGLQDVADRLTAGEQLQFSQVTSVQDGMAEVFFSIAQALNGEASDDYVLVYVRAATFLRPDDVDSLLLCAQLLDALGQYDLAVATYKKIPATSPDYHAAEMGRQKRCGALPNRMRRSRFWNGLLKINRPWLQSIRPLAICCANKSNMRKLQLPMTRRWNILTKGQLRVGFCTMRGALAMNGLNFGIRQKPISEARSKSTLISLRY